MELKPCDSHNIGVCDQPLNLSRSDHRKSFTALNHSSIASNHSDSNSMANPLKTFNHSSIELKEKSSQNSSQNQQNNGEPQKFYVKF